MRLRAGKVGEGHLGFMCSGRSVGGRGLEQGAKLPVLRTYFLPLDLGESIWRVLGGTPLHLQRTSRNLQHYSTELRSFVDHCSLTASSIAR